MRRFFPTTLLCVQLPSCIELYSNWIWLVDWNPGANTHVQSTHLNEPENAEYAQVNGFDQTFQTYEADAYGDGPLQLSYQGYVPDSNVGFMRALEAVNIPVVNELNTGNATGVKQGLGTLDNRLRRSSSFDSFYRQAQNRSNLDVLFNAPVSELVLDTEGDTPTATGVVFVDQNTGLIHQVSAAKEVIMSMGAFHSPQLLMLSVSSYHKKAPSAMAELIRRLVIGHRATVRIGGFRDHTVSCERERWTQVSVAASSSQYHTNTILVSMITACSASWPLQDLSLLRQKCLRPWKICRRPKLNTMQTCLDHTQLHLVSRMASRNSRKRRSKPSILPK